MVDVMQGIDSVAKSIQERLSAKAAYGEPISANGVTVVPVAKVSFGFGGGGGSGTGPATSNGAAEAMAEHAVRMAGGGGGGGGGGAAVKPVGYIEMTDAGSRWVPIEAPRSDMMMNAVMVLALLLPGRGGRGFLAKLVLMLVGQAMVRRLVRPDMPMLPNDFSFPRREHAEATV
jgi:uncharacterized spore protein YtfJ